ncbi:mitochondrial assembly of ribosomal large subunit protein 1 [Genypterus blacodes]|uniref:mitochondrial assembly of ribosomal large subunit protein 1 n=1 Tax=Genypterus blacodes TaxID=154954 RepID=UPI003F76A7FE
MSVINRSVQSVSSLFKRCVLLERSGFRSVPTARCHGVILPPRWTGHSASCRHLHRLPASAGEFRTNRFYSQVFHGDSSGSERTSGACVEEDAEEMEMEEDTGVDHRPLEGFSLDVLVSLLRQENAVDMCVIRVPEQIKYTQYFLVVGGISPRHLRAMALYAVKVYKYLKKEEDPPAKVGGKDSDDWVCIDFGSIVCHFMLPETRDVYELEKLWTLRMYDEQLRSVPAETIPEDYMYDFDVKK